MLSALSAEQFLLYLISLRRSSVLSQTRLLDQALSSIVFWCNLEHIDILLGMQTTWCAQSTSKLRWASLTRSQVGRWPGSTSSWWRRPSARWEGILRSRWQATLWDKSTRKSGNLTGQMEIVKFLSTRMEFNLFTQGLCKTNILYFNQL